jgi:LuxR family maltose regulon positive regulatory protein
VARPRLAGRLAEGVARGIVLVCGPAGFGKTALLSEWARHSRWPVAWLSLDSDDSDPARFWRYVAATLDAAGARVAERVAALLRGPQQPPLEAVVTALINQLAAVPDEVVLVLDDYHLIQAPQVHQSLEFLLERLPPQLRVVLASRADLPLPLARFRGRGQLAELRAADLRFTPEEAAVLLREATGVDLPTGSVAALAARTEGWVAGLQLAALSLRGDPNITAFVQRFSGSHRFVLDYLTEEVLDRQPQQVREFLLETSVLARLCGPLCQAVTGRSDSQPLLEGIERANLFLMPLDEVRRWWRYHHLFADLLLARLQQEQPNRVAELHRAAAAWSEQHELVDDAVRHALAAGDAEWAARLVERHFHRLLWRGEGATLERWLAALPAPVVRAQPWLCLGLAYKALIGGHLDEVEPLLADAERAHLTRSGDPREPSAGRAASPLDKIPTMIAVLRADVARMHGDVERATRLAEQAMAGPTADDPMVRWEADWTLAETDWAAGRLARAERRLARLITTQRAAGMHDLTLQMSYELGQVLRAQGRLGAALRTYREALEGTAGHPTPAEGLAHVGLAEVLRERNELDAALDHATRGVGLCRRLASAWPLASGLATLARIRQAQGDQAGALQALAEAERVLPDPELAELSNPVPVQNARLALAQGDVPAAARWVQARGLSDEDQPSFAREGEYLVLARVLLAEQAPQRALGLLERLSAQAGAQGRTGSVIQLRALQALASAACGDEHAALAALAEALTLGAPEGYLRVFVDEGAPMAALVGGLLMGRRREQVAAAGAVPRDHLIRLVEAFEQAGLPIRPSARRGAVVVPGLVEPLTAREVEVLRRLAAGAPNRVIAEQLVVTLETVKKHLSHVFDKLGAANRTQAVARARELGLLP